MKIKDEELIKDIKRTAKKLGKNSVSVKEYEKHGGYSRKTITRRFGTWNSAVLIAGLCKNNKHCSGQKRRAPFERKRIRGEQRHAIMKRDYFKCRLCGKSPATDPSVELHIDHIIPVARGGTNDKENLWTLCSMCNMKKLDNIDNDIITLAKVHLYKFKILTR